MELVAESEPVIYRNFIQGAGTRAIGVGYPEKVNLAFDANNLCLAMVWQGPVIDAARHWSGRGEGFEPPLGNNVVKMPEGPPFAILPDNESSWPSTGGKQGGYRMLGYRLDDKRRPTFMYTFNDIRIEESYEPIMGEVDAYLKRTIALKGPAADHLWFRAATGNIEARGNEFVLDERIHIRFAGATAVVRESGGRNELVAPVRFTRGEAKIVQEIIW
jgi:hypothetical protein